MTKKKRTFGELNRGCYFWGASTFGVDRLQVFYTYNHQVYPNIVIMSSSPSNIKQIQADSTEYHDDSVDWFTNKADAQMCAYQKMIAFIRDREREVEFAKHRARKFRESCLPNIKPQEEDWVLTRINRQVHEELERQKREGKEFLSEEEVDAVIAKVLKEKNF